METSIENILKNWSIVHFNHPLFNGEICKYDPASGHGISKEENTIIYQVKKYLSLRKLEIIDIKITAFVDYVTYIFCGNHIKYVSRFLSNLYCMTNNKIYLLQIDNKYQYDDRFKKHFLYESKLSFNEMFIFKNQSDLKIFTNSFRKHEGFFSNACIEYCSGSHVGKSCTGIDSYLHHYEEYIEDLEKYIKTFSGTFFYSLKNGWDFMIEPSGKTLYYNEEEREATYIRPSEKETEYICQELNQDLIKTEETIDQKINRIVEEKLKEHLNSVSQNMDLLIKLLSK